MTPAQPLIGNSQEPILVSDPGLRGDPQFIHPDNPNCWKAVPYQTDSFSGTMLACGSGPEPLPIRVQLNVQGRYRIWVGLYGFGNSSALRLRLSNDLCCRVISPPGELRGIGPESLFLPEIPWKIADLTGQDLFVEPEYTQAEQVGALAFLRLEPVEAPAPPKNKQTERTFLAVTNDGHGIFGRRPHHRPEDLLEQFEALPSENSIRMLIWGAGDGDMCNYPTKVGNFFPTENSYANPFRRTLHDNMARWQEKGWNSLEVVRDYAKNRGWEFQVYLRMEAFDSPFPFDRILYSDFYRRHPEYRCHDREGRPVQRLSYAHAGVRDHIADLIGEIAGYRPDGVCLAFIRGVPLVLYEPIVVEGFSRQYGLDPRQLSETDSRWLEYQAGILTAFVRQARSRLKPGQKLSAIVPANEMDCLRWGLDVATWVREGIVDDVFPTGQKFDEMDVHRDDPKNLDMAWFQGLPGRGKIRLMPLLYMWELFHGDYPGWRKCLDSFLSGGADGYVVWDIMEAPDYSKADPWYEPTNSQNKPTGRKIKLTSLDGFRFDRYHHFEVI